MTSFLVNVIILFVALFVLVLAAKKTVDSLILVAKSFDVSDALIAMSIVAVGTSLPEIGTHVMASLGIVAGTLDLGITSATTIGGNMGSSTVQQLLLVGILFIGTRRTTYSKRFFLDTYLPMLGTFVLVFALAYDGLLSRVDGLVLLLIFSGYMVVSFQNRQRDLEVPGSDDTSLWLNTVIVLGGLTLVVLSAFVSLNYIEKIVELTGLNGTMVGTISLGFASALPELTTVVESIRRSNPYIALGTLVGSNVVNPLVGIGGGAAISTYTVPPSLLVWDLPFKFLIGLGLLIWIYYGRNRQAGIQEGFYLIAGYFVYLSFRLVYFA